MSAADRKPADTRPTFRLVLKPVPACTDPVRQLRHLLKRALRSHGLRCISAEQVPPPNSDRTTEVAR
jgi:hypothetical protein